MGIMNAVFRYLERLGSMTTDKVLLKRIDDLWQKTLDEEVEPVSTPRTLPPRKDLNMDILTTHCRRMGHSFPRPLVGGEQCDKCGVIYCPVAYDHEDEPCACCGWDGIE